MKQANILAVLLAVSLLLCACSAAAVTEQEAGMGLAIPLSEPVGTGFHDIPSGAYYEEAANWCREQGIFTGALFSPGAAMTRNTVADSLCRAEGRPEIAAMVFSDIPAGSDFLNAASWASTTGVMSGYRDGRFGGADPVTRQQMAAVLWRYAGGPAAEIGEDFADEAAIASYAKAAVDWARSNGIINGKNGNLFDPEGTLTRAQAAAILYRYLNWEEQDPAPTGSGDKPSVYMTTDISSAGLMKIYESLGRPVQGDQVAVKLSMGEPGGHNFLQPSLIEPLVKEVDGTIVDSNTAYGGRRASTALHYQTAEDHGFTAIAPVQILDEDGESRIPVNGGERLTENIVGGHFTDYDFYVVLSHFKGHAMGGFGGAIKNISIGISSPAGKMLQHSGGHSSASWSGGTQDQFLEAMAEAAKSVDDYMGDHILYISVMNKLSVDCDCDSNPAEPDMHDIGILASTDPVALDQACVDLVYTAEDGASLIARIESRNGIHTLEHAEKIGLGSREYQLVSID